MPGKVNPYLMRGYDHDSGTGHGEMIRPWGWQPSGEFELTVFMPVCIYNFLQSVNLVCRWNNRLPLQNCVFGIKANRERMDWNLHNSADAGHCTESIFRI